MVTSTVALATMDTVTRSFSAKVTDAPGASTAGTDPSSTPTVVVAVASATTSTVSEASRAPAKA